jgi:hypothetical protein
MSDGAGVGCGPRAGEANVVTVPKSTQPRGGRRWRDLARIDPPPRVRRAAVVAASGVVVMAGLALAVMHGDTANLDLRGHAWALGHRGGLVADVARWVTRGGQFNLVLPVVVVAGLLTAVGGAWRRIRAAAWLGAVFGGGILVRLAVADLLGRARPPRVDWIAPAAGYAFPSGHTASPLWVPAWSPGPSPAGCVAPD